MSEYDIGTHLVLLELPDGSFVGHPVVTMTPVVDEPVCLRCIGQLRSCVRSDQHCWVDLLRWERQ